MEAIPGPLKFLELDRQIRYELWDVIFPFLLQYRHSPAREGCSWVAQVYRHVWKKPLDEAYCQATDYELSVSKMKRLVYEGKVADFLEAVQVTLRMQGIPNDFKQSLIKVITSGRTSYGVIDGTIVPLASPEERDDVVTNLMEVSSSPLTGAYAHLKKAAAELSAGNRRDAVRESIHAVESAAIYLTGKQEATLGDALALIQKTSPIHSTMKTAFEKLYAYTNAEKGIRHALLESENERVGREEALFMFSACTAFVGYLIRKNLNGAAHGIHGA